MTQRYCTYPDCGGKYYAKGFCCKHYMHWQRGTLDAPPKRTKKAAAFKQRPRQCICGFCGVATPHKILREVIDQGHRALWFGCLRCKDIQSVASGFWREQGRSRNLPKMRLGKGRL